MTLLTKCNIYKFTNTAATWKNSYEAIIAAAKRSRDEKYASLLPKPKRIVGNNIYDSDNNTYDNKISSISSIKYNLRSRKILDLPLNNKSNVNDKNIWKTKIMNE